MDCAGTGMSGDQQLTAVGCTLITVVIIACLIFIYALVVRNDKE